MKKMITNNIPTRFGTSIALAVMLLAAATTFTGCGTMPSGTSAPPQAMEKTHTESINLREGDELKITFPGSPNLDTQQPIRRDGKLNLPLIGEVSAVGQSPSQLQEKLVQAYASQISTKEVIVQVVSSMFPVYLTGAVIHPGKVMSNHPMTALDAVMEAGGFDYTTADMKRVKIVRNVGGTYEHFVVDLKSVLEGTDTKSFYLQPEDIVYVPERFTPF